jgi:predicted nuclease with RNAse H fold
MPRWLGVDVGGARKGFDVALVDEHRLLLLRGGLRRAAVVELADTTQPALVAIDGPRSCAPDGQTARDDERALNRAVCGIRWTPDARQVRANPYYAWILAGLELFEALAARGINAIEVFPTASWTRWFGPRRTATRAGWSARGLAALRLAGTPERTNQDQRDAIAAAVTARQHTQGHTDSIGEIVVPAGSWPH